MDIKKIKIGVLMGGLSSEREVSLMSGNAVFAALKESGFNVTPIDVGKDIIRRLVEEKFEAAFIALHGKFGEDGAIQGVLDIMGIPFTGSPLLSSAMAMNKSVSKELFEHHNIPTPAYNVISREMFRKGEVSILMKPPVVVKPVNGGSTIGITFVKRKIDLTAAIEEALRWDNEAMIEQYIDGPLVTVGILGDEPLPVIEIAPKKGFYDYSAKYTSGETDYFLPARISVTKQVECQRLAMEAHRVLHCHGATRTDLIIGKDDTPFMLEVNTSPGMTGTSLLPMAAKAAGLDFAGLSEKIVTLALTRLSRKSQIASTKSQINHNIQLSNDLLE